MLMRIQLLGPNEHVMSDQQYNELFTMHGAIMLLLFATPLFVGFANELLPLQIGAPDVAFPRLNLLSYYMFTFGGLILLASFLTPGGAASFGWYAYSPLTSAIYSPGIGADMWIMGLTLSGHDDLVEPVIGEHLLHGLHRLGTAQVTLDGDIQRTQVSQHLAEPLPGLRARFLIGGGVPVVRHRPCHAGLQDTSRRGHVRIVCRPGVRDEQAERARSRLDPLAELVC